MKYQTALIRLGLCVLAFTLILQFSQPARSALRFFPSYDFAVTPGDVVHAAYKFNSISSDGRYIAFATERYGLVSGDSDSIHKTDVYLKDLLLNRLILVSTAYNSTAPGNNVSDAPSISDEVSGKIRVAFRSQATDITNNSSIPAVSQIYVREYNTSNLSLASTTLVSANGSNLGNGNSTFPRITRNGQYIAFASESDNFGIGDTSANADIYRKDLTGGTLTWISQKSGVTGGSSDAPAISSTGRYVVFSSTKQLISGVSSQKHVYLWDDQVAVQPFDLISVDTAGNEGNQQSGLIIDNQYGCDVSSDGKYVVFTSGATNLDSADTTTDRDVFLRDRSNLSSKTTVLISTAAYTFAQDATISDDGNYIAFDSSLGSTDHAIRVYDRRFGALRTLPSDSAVQYPDISGNGRFVVSTQNLNSLTARPFIYDWIAPAQLNSGDFNADGFTDLAYFRPSTGVWSIALSPAYSPSAPTTYTWGTSTDKLAPGDYDADGITDFAYFRPSTGTWYVLTSSNNTTTTYGWGTNGDLPVPVDYDKDNKTDVALYRPSDYKWYIVKSSGGTIVQQFGAAGDVPVPGDYDGDNIGDIAIYRPSVGEWWVQRSTLGTITFTFGNSSDKAVQADYTGDGKTDVAIWRPSTGYWYILRSEDFSYYSFPFGISTDLPSPGDYDNDGKADAAIFRPSSGDWYAQRTTPAGTLIVNHGQSGDKPIPNVFVP